MQAVDNLVRKQYLMGPNQLNKIDFLAKGKKTSAAMIVRMAIDAFNPDVPAEMDESELLELVQTRVKEAIEDTQKTRERLIAALTELEGAK